MSYNQGVDFKEVIIRGGSAPKKPDAPKKPNTESGAPKPRAKDDEGPVQEMPHELKIAIMKARQAKNMTQKQLAQALNIPAQVSKHVYIFTYTGD
jgi:ribosome-binding protein aMBF1 (putative translation factor)